jgi:hypothetical protein
VRDVGVSARARRPVHVKEGGDGKGPQLAPVAELCDRMPTGSEASGEELHRVERGALARLGDGPGQGSNEDRLALLRTPRKGPQRGCELGLRRARTAAFQECHSIRRTLTPSMFTDTET